MQPDDQEGLGYPMKTWTPNLKKVELCLTYRCNVHCANCSNLCTQAPMDRGGDLFPAEVAEFIGGSVRAEHRWELITLHGGEPVLNKDIVRICEMLEEYRNIHNPSVVISFLTNGSTPKILSDVADLCKNYRFEMGVSEKVESNKRGDGTPIPYVPVNESPVDLGLEYDDGCFQTQDCGICYNYQGYWPCSPMAAAARVFGLETLIHTAGKLTVEGLREMLNLHCHRCGFAMPSRRRVVEQTSTDTWTKAFEAYNAA